MIVAVTPIAAPLIARANPVSVLLVESIVIVEVAPPDFTSGES